MNKKYQNNINMIKNNIVLEIKEINKKMSVNENKLNNYQKNINENKLAYLKELNTHNLSKNEYNTFNNDFNNYKKIVNNYKYDTTILPDNNNFFNKFIVGDNLNNNNSWIIIPKISLFSGIENINDYTCQAQHDLNILWRTKGNNTYNHGLLIWDNMKEKKIIKQHQINNDGKSIITKTIPENDYIVSNYDKETLSEINICGEKQKHKWLTFKKDNNLDFRGSPLKSSSLERNTVFFNQTNMPTKIKIVNKYENGTYEFWCWDESTKTKERTLIKDKKYVKTILPGYFIAIKLINYVKLNIHISNVKKEPDDSFISEWRMTQIKRNNFFAFVNNVDLTYQIKVFHSEPVYKSILFLQDYQENDKKLKTKLIEQVKNMEKIKILIELDTKKINELNQHKRSFEKKENLLLYIKSLNQHKEIIINNKNLLTKQSRIDEAKKYLNLIYLSQEKSKEIIDSIPKNLYDTTDISNNSENETIFTNAKIIKKYKNDLHLLDLSIENFKKDIKSALMNNFKNEVNDILEKIKFEYENIINIQNQIKNKHSIESIDINNYLIQETQINSLKNKMSAHYNVLNTNDKLMMEKNKYFKNNDISNSYLFNIINIAQEFFDKSTKTVDMINNDIEKIFLKTRSVVDDNKTTIDDIIKIITDTIAETLNKTNKTKQNIEINKTANDTKNTQIDKLYNDINAQRDDIKKIYKRKSYYDNDDNFLDVKSESQGFMVKINSLSTEILNNDMNSFSMIENLKKLYESNSNKIKEQRSIIENKTSTNTDIIDYSKTKFKSIEKIQNDFNAVQNDIKIYEKEFTNQKKKEKETNLNLQLEKSMNSVHETNTYIKLSEIESSYNKLNIENNKASDIAVDIISYIDSKNINFFEKYIQANNKYDLIKRLFDDIEKKYNSEKSKLTVVIEEINCIKNDLTKVKNLLNEIDDTQTLNNNLNINIKTTKKTIRQIKILIDELTEKKNTLEQTGSVNINNSKTSFQIDPIVVKNTKKQFFRNINETLSVITNILPPPTDSKREFIIRYIYRDDSIFVNNSTHAEASKQIDGQNNNIGILGLKYYKKNDLPFFQFFELNNKQPYSLNTELEVGYYYNESQGIWNLQNTEKTFGEDTSEEWLKIWNKNTEPLYKNNNDNVVWYKVYENNYPKNTRFGYNNTKTTHFELFGNQSTNSGKNGPRQLALKTNAGLLGWLGDIEKKRIEKEIDNRINLGSNRKLSLPVDFNYSNGEGMFILNYSENDTVFFNTFKDVHVKSRTMSNNYYMFFTIQNINDESIVNFYKSMSIDLTFDDTILSSDNIFLTCSYTDYLNDTEVDPLLKNIGGYKAKDINFYKKSGPDKNNTYIFAQLINGIEEEYTITTYINEKNNANRFNVNVDELLNIHIYNKNALLSIEKTVNGITSYLLEERKINLNTFEIDKSNDGLLNTYLYKNITEFNDKPNQGKYFLITDIINNNIDTNNYIKINDKSTDLYSISSNITIEHYKNDNLLDFKLKNIYIDRNNILNILNSNKFGPDNYLLDNLTLDGENFKDVKMNITNDKIIFFDILNKEYYDVGNKMKEFTFINKNNYWKYYDTIDPNYSLFPNDNLPQVKTHKIRIESYEPFPLEILNMDVFFKDQNNVKNKYMPEFSSNPYTFKNSKQSSTSNIEHKASKAVNGELNTFSQTAIEFNNNLKWFEVSLNPPNIITSIEFYARETISFKNRINNVNIFLIDENGKKINWKWKQTSLGDTTKKIILDGKSSVLSDKLDNPQIFEEIDSVQPFSYYPQNYIEKFGNTLIYRIENNTYNWNITNLQKWDDIYLPLQKIKKEYTERYNKNLINYGFYILPDSKWDYNWINNGKLGIDSINNGFDDVLNIYSTDTNNDKSSLIFTYIYDGTTNNYYLNGNIMSNKFIKKNNDMINDEINISLVDNTTFQHKIITKKTFTQKENAVIKKKKKID